jgi:FixJ family two-component response regulator
LLVTSYGVEEALDELEEYGVADVIEKPVAAHTLARVVRRVLEA